MRVHQIVKPHALQGIAESGAGPVQKQQPATIGLDAKMAGSMLANEVFAECIGEGNKWKCYADRVVNGTVDFRMAFIDAIDKQLKEWRKRNAALGAELDKTGAIAPNKDQQKRAAKLVASATVQVSNLRTIARAFNGAASIEGLILYVQETRGTKPKGLDEVAFYLMREYAATFKETKAGAPKHTWLDNFTKFVETRKPDEDDAEGIVAYGKAVALLNSLKGKMAAPF